MMRARWCSVMNLRESRSRPGSGRVVESELTNGTVPKSDLRASEMLEGIPFRYQMTDRLFYRSIRSAGDFDRKTSAHPAGDAQISRDQGVRANLGKRRAR